MEGELKMPKTTCGIIVALLIISVSLLVFDVQTVKAAGTIYIRADGAVDPSSAPILNVGNVSYTFTADIYDSVIVERNNIVVDGAGYTLQGAGSGTGIDLTGRSNVTIKSTTIRNFGCAINLTSSSGNTLSADTITNSTFGIYLSSSSINSVSANNITNNEVGIRLSSSSNGNSIIANSVTNNTYYGVDLSSSSNSNSVSANTIANNKGEGIHFCSSSGNSIFANTIKNNNYEGISLCSSSDSNSISANTITSNGYGIALYPSSDSNSISANTIKNNNYEGIYLVSSSSNSIYHNNVEDNPVQAYASLGYMNVWDDGYPSGGNYWSDYAGADSNGDGIGDTSYVIDANNVDHYPLMSPWAAISNVTCLAVRGQDNIIYYRTYNVTTASWAGWNALPGATCDSPAATLCGNELHLVVRGMDGNTLWYGYVNLIGGGFSGWTLLSGSTPSAPTLTSNGTALSLVVRCQNNLIYYRFYIIATRTWTDWSALPSGATCDSPAATMLANKLHLVVRGMDGFTLWHGSVDLSTQAFSGWDLVGGATESEPILTVSESRSEVYLVVRGLNNVIYRNSWNGLGWTGWAGLLSGSTCDGVGATVIGETLQVVVRGMDGYTLWHGTVDLTDNFPGWTLISGSTPSTPTLTS